MKGRTVLLRVDFNVAVGKGGKIAPEADVRLREAIPTIERLLEGGARVIAVSHLGRPKGWDAKLSLKPVAKHLEGLMGRPVTFVGESLTRGKAVERALAGLGDGQLAVLENIRFYPAEEKNDPKFAKRLAGLADVFVNDAFGTCHRAHASTAGVARSFRERYAGLLVEREVAGLNRLLVRPKRPFVVLMGGAKVSDKLPALKMMLKTADRVMVGGGMANAFLAAKGWNTGKSRVAGEEIRFAKGLLKNSGKKILLPVDILAASSLSERAKVRVVPADRIGKGDYAVDIGVATVLEYARLIRKAKTVVWNGPMGIFEIRKFSHGTVSLGRMVAAHSRGRAFGVVGGGETITALEMTGMAEWVDHVSTGGGAMLDFLSGKPLPGIRPLMR